MTDDQRPPHRKRPTFTDQEALQFHAQGRPGKLEVVPTKPMATQRDLSLAYSPGVAVPVLAIAQNPSTAFDYTTRANMVAVISNGTAILGLGNLGALASKPVMEGKAVLFKRFADVDSIDLEVDTEDADAFINCVRYLGPSFGGINLEDIKAPECFIIEERLRELMDIPVFHDDQHGTAIIAAAGLINALHLTGRDMAETRLVVNGAGAAGIACTELLKAMGFAPNNVILCDTKGAIYRGRTEGMNQWKSAHAAETSARTLADALDGADAVFGLSAKGAFTDAMIRSMAPNPIIFAMANPDPEITPEEVARIRDDVIIATGRSDYPNQVNNVLGFPYIFRGALDVQATTINMEMKIAAAQALAELAREDVPDEVAAAYQGARPRFGRDYIIPVPFDPRLIHTIPMAVARAAMDTGVSRRPIVDMPAYKAQLSARRDPVAGTLNRIFERVRKFPKRVVFAEGEEERVIRAALSFMNQGLGKGHPGRARGPHHGNRRPGGHRSRRPRGRRDPQCAPLPAQQHLCAVPLRAPAAQGLPVPRLPAPDQPGPQPLRRLHGGARRRGRHGDGGDPQLLDGARRRAPRDRREARPPGHRRVPLPGAGPHGARGRYGDPRDAQRPGACGDRHRDRRRRAALRVRASRGAAVLLHLRPSEGGARREDPGGGGDPRPDARGFRV
jgi:malate dehydrogenase (oxaloacetate-decarboxylating)(NADP+)